MTSEQKGKAGQGDCPVTDYGQRAATALDQLLPGPHRDKAVARLFGVSVRFAKYLRAGDHWTAHRLSQASAVLGAAFDAALYQPASDDRRNSELVDIAERLARVEARFVEMDRGNASGLASAPSVEAVVQSGKINAQLGYSTRRRAADRDNQSPPDKRAAMASPLQRREVKR